MPAPTVNIECRCHVAVQGIWSAYAPLPFLRLQPIRAWNVNTMSAVQGSWHAVTCMPSLYRQPPACRECQHVSTPFALRGVLSADIYLPSLCRDPKCILCLQHTQTVSRAEACEFRSRSCWPYLCVQHLLDELAAEGAVFLLMLACHTYSQVWHM